MRDQQKLSEFLKSEMKKRSYSLRILSQISSIDHATLSKIISGKRKANLNHLQKLADSFEMEITKLLEMAGYTSDKNDDLQKTWNAVQRVVDTMSPINEEISYEHVNHEIVKFEKLSQTTSGKKTIREKFENKLEETSGAGKYVEQLKTMYSHFIQNKGHHKDQLLIGAALLYFIVTTDLLPDYLLPVGLLDDAFIVQVISQRLENKSLLL